MISFAEKRLDKRKREVDCRFVYHERLLWSISVHFKSDIRMSNIGDTITDTQEAFGDEHVVPSRGGVIITVPTAAGDDEGDLIS